jgi:hypothetical protein
VQSTGHIHTKASSVAVAMSTPRARNLKEPQTFNNGRRERYSQEQRYHSYTDQGSANYKQKTTEQTQARSAQETEIGHEKGPHRFLWPWQESSWPNNSRQPNQYCTPTLCIASRHSNGQGRQRSRSGRKEGQQQQLVYTSHEEKERQEQYHTSGRGRQGGTE